MDGMKQQQSCGDDNMSAEKKSQPFEDMHVFAETYLTRLKEISVPILYETDMHSCYLSSPSTKKPKTKQNNPPKNVY